MRRSDGSTAATAMLIRWQVSRSSISSKADASAPSSGKLETNHWWARATAEVGSARSRPAAWAIAESTARRTPAASAAEKSLWVLPSKRRSLGVGGSARRCSAS